MRDIKSIIIIIITLSLSWYYSTTYRRRSMKFGR